ncbi:MAG: glycosyltransferase family 2 protein [Pseudomonadales bacterium]|nr:glycosyltransferase family 2 protein [Pseudomonadales bacterium]MBO6704201.1 glycosyltransferase family 2 protein [Pseudomonadales bacterium]MBO7005992.1 glycosyltransferase family 2 protein [Pseudomonadales bacterium]
MKISIVTALYNSETYVSEFVDRCRNAVLELTDDYEIILVNDASPDNALSAAIREHEADGRVMVIDLSRNFGQHKANWTGLSHASGDYVFLIEADLEEQPEWLGEFYQALSADQSVDVVYGQQNERKGDWFERISGELFYKAFNLFSPIKIPANHITVRLMTRRYVQAFIAHQERDLFVGGMYKLAGFGQRPQIVNKLSTSETTYSLGRKLNLLVNAIVSFSSIPLWLIFWLGVFFSATASGVIFWTIIKWATGSPEPGWTSIVASIWAVGGMLMASIGIIGIYLKKVIAEIRSQPYTIIRQIYKQN